MERGNSRRIVLDGRVELLTCKEAKNSNALKRMTRGIRTTGPVYKKIQRVWLAIIMSLTRSMMKVRW
jgi:hypothetical protein